MGRPGISTTTKDLICDREIRVQGTRQVMYSFLANLVAAVHVGYVGFVVIGQLLILLGLALGWEWVRHPPFRIAHLVAIGIVALETLASIRCPLSDLEDYLRGLAGEPVEGGDFLARTLHGAIHIDLPYNHWLFTASYLGFAILVLGTYILAPPRWKKGESA